MAAQVRAVDPDERPPARKRAKTITQAAKSGTEVELLEALQARVARAVQDRDTPPRDLAALTKRLMDITRELEAARVKDQEAGSDGAVTADETWRPQAL
ncbi:Gp7 [Propionibacterium freudenreichii]|uniref:Terminase small subunit n=2 Tax=root TaxID=1 RepID=A0A1D8ETP9_9CAUD|nr:hypothetical protein [Propionibacterium freudenreichii]YP_009596923.1 terminase small subunit [Propionibacterium phage Doucette]AOT24415.1 hypothetical protein DOUCETTE_2 [Propionibacterium phage Doucette]CEG88966.1 Gp7 [Propionibacterium freudenreichii]CEH08741.1 Gp7 [Propionibacterium freudenreichii]SBW77611.1 Hypothetical protein PFR_JS22-1_1963 [Propionibacterium freudenreichii]SCP02365.1 Hypothetical protein PFR_JS22-PH_37 [Propionibacterium freudenreichii]